MLECTQNGRHTAHLIKTVPYLTMTLHLHSSSWNWRGKGESKAALIKFLNTVTCYSSADQWMKRHKSDFYITRIHTPSQSHKSTRQGETRIKHLNYIKQRWKPQVVWYHNHLKSLYTFQPCVINASISLQKKTI